MRKLFLVALIIAAASSASFAQNNNSASQNQTDAPNMGRAPSGPDGIGRLDLRIVDEAGNPVKGVKANLESQRPNGLFCESWNATDERGIAVLPPLHMGRLLLKLKANGFQTQKLVVQPGNLNEPLRVTMLRKK